ncbi:MAG: inositol monophosphatase [Rhodobacteraceae bacterium]|nr:inositol monophosphatase [Paracoccaceae bacterium]
MQGSANLNLMIKAARKAGRALVKDFREVENLQVSSKAAADFVARATIAAERIIREDLMEARPNYGWLARDSDPVEGKDPTRRWIADPLGGAENFVHGMPHWSVSVALEFKSEIIAAVVFDPAKDELFVSEKGAGTFMNDKRLRVSNRNVMSECLFATGIPFAAKRTLPATLHDLAQLMPACAGVRQWGGAALDMAYVAAGRFDGYWERELQPWDYSAGLLLVREAGGFTAPIRDGADIAERGEVIAANSGVFDSFTRVLRKRPE